MERLLTPEEVADQLRVTRRTVYEWLRTGRLRGLRAGQFWRIRPEDVEAFLETGDEEERLSAEDLEAVRRGLEDVRAGRLKSLEQYERERGLEPAD
ncbi:MAG: helix-turn-helix domain-containing protein [Clostridia bacterium]|nr:helix-turn-helix domain-containing protein [Clostridia bacterium]